MTVYFARRRKDGLIKVGVSEHLKERMQDLKADLLGTMPGGATDERLIRRMFHHSRVRDGSEWLKPSPDVLAFIEEPEASKRFLLDRFAESQQKALQRLIDRLEGPKP